ncbi:MAG: DUF4040 domain-containing protein [Rhodobacteraceae bacterium]|nr:MAG: DUF4040 domain-containing protein [Paracoccaceae bacterium]
MSAAVLLLDGALALGLVFFGARAVFAARAAAAVANFIALGTLTALAWARLSAPDVALAEAAIGAGMTGALLLRHLTLTDGEE